MHVCSMTNTQHRACCCPSPCLPQGIELLPDGSLSGEDTHVQAGGWRNMVSNPLMRGVGIPVSKHVNRCWWWVTSQSSMGIAGFLRNLLDQLLVAFVIYPEKRIVYKNYLHALLFDRSDSRDLERHH